MSDIDRSDLIPWDWAITPLDQTLHTCPPPSHILGVFGVINVVSSLLGLVSGHRILIKRLTCSKMGKSGSHAWAITWVIQTGLVLGANAFNAWLTVNSAGYDLERMPKIWDLMLFYCARPRLGWIALLIAATLSERKNYGGWWTSAALQSAVTEIVMIVLGSYYMGRTLHSAAIHGYLLPHHLDGVPFKSAYDLMASGSILYLILGLFSILALGLLVNEGNDLDSLSALILVLCVSLLPWMASWLFFSGFVDLAGPL
jgi:hypothetical protein